MTRLASLEAARALVGHELTRSASRRRSRQQRSFRRWTPCQPTGAPRGLPTAGGAPVRATERPCRSLRIAPAWLARAKRAAEVGGHWAPCSKETSPRPCEIPGPAPWRGSQAQRTPNPGALTHGAPARLSGREVLDRRGPQALRPLRTCWCARQRFGVRALVPSLPMSRSTRGAREQPWLVGDARAAVGAPQRMAWISASSRPWWGRDRARLDGATENPSASWRARRALAGHWLPCLDPNRQRLPGSRSMVTCVADRPGEPAPCAQALARPRGWCGAGRGPWPLRPPWNRLRSRPRRRLVVGSSPGGGAGVWLIPSSERRCHRGG